VGVLVIVHDMIIHKYHVVGREDWYSSQQPRLSWQRKRHRDIFDRGRKQRLSDRRISSTVAALFTLYYVTGFFHAIVGMTAVWSSVVTAVTCKRCQQ